MTIEQVLDELHRMALQTANKNNVKPNNKK